MAGIFKDDSKLPKPISPLLDNDQVIVQNRRHVQDPYGGHYEDVGDPILVTCNVEGRAQQAGMFSISGQEDRTPASQGGLQEVTPIQILARDWPGNIDSEIWWRGCPYDADGAPVYRAHGTDLVTHWVIRARRSVDTSLIDLGITPPNPVQYAKGTR